MKKRGRHNRHREGWVHPLDRAADLLNSMERLTAGVGAAGATVMVGIRNGLPIYTTTFKRPISDPRRWDGDDP